MFLMFDMSCSMYCKIECQDTSGNLWNSCLYLSSSLKPERHGEINFSPSSSNLKVRVHDNKEFKGSWPHLNLTPSRPVLAKPQHRARNELYRSMALKMEEHIRTTLMFLPLSSLGSVAEMVTLCHIYDLW